jgi:hypothetical protein
MRVRPGLLLAAAARLRCSAVVAPDSPLPQTRRPTWSRSSCSASAAPSISWWPRHSVPSRSNTQVSYRSLGWGGGRGGVGGGMGARRARRPAAPNPGQLRRAAGAPAAGAAPAPASPPCRRTRRTPSRPTGSRRAAGVPGGAAGAAAALVARTRGAAAGRRAGSGRARWRGLLAARSTPRAVAGGERRGGGGERVRKWVWVGAGRASRIQLESRRGLNLSRPLFPSHPHPRSGRAPRRRCGPPSGPPPAR